MFTYLLFLIVFAVGTALERRTLKYTEAAKPLTTLACCRLILCCVDEDCTIPFADISKTYPLGNTCRCDTASLVPNPLLVADIVSLVVILVALLTLVII